MYKTQTVTLVLPCYNEARGLEAMLPRVPEIVDEIIVVDNASDDGSAAVAASLGARVVAESRRGYGAAYKAGFSAANTDIIITMDADDTYPLEAITSLVTRLVDDNYDFITVRRMVTNWEHTFMLALKFFGKKILDYTMSLLFLRLIHDSQSGMWVFRRDILRQIRLESDGMSFSEEIKAEAMGHRQIRSIELPVKYAYRKRLGVCKLSTFRDGFANLFFLFKKRVKLFSSK